MQKLASRFFVNFGKNSSFLGAEWTYLLTTRKVAGDDSAFSFVRIQYGSNPTDTVSGMVIYPDDFSFADAGVGALNFGANYAITQIDATTWEALEDMGCVFLPCARNRLFTDGQPSISEAGFGQYSYYWSSSANNASTAYHAYFNFSSKYVRPADNSNRYVGYSVRLVQDL